MSSNFFEPVVQDLGFHLYNRALHPELFEILATRRVEREDYHLAVHITPTGHLLHWQSGDRVLMEVTGQFDTPLPSRGQLIRHRFHGERTDSTPLGAGLSYQMSSQVEVLEPEIFLHVHDEILGDGLKRGMLHRIGPHHRFRLSPLGYVTIESWQRCFSISTFHTFPDEWTVVKTQSLIERE